MQKNEANFSLQRRIFNLVQKKLNISFGLYAAVWASKWFTLIVWFFHGFYRFRLDFDKHFQILTVRNKLIVRFESEHDVN